MSWSKEDEEELQRLARENLSDAKRRVINDLYNSHRAWSDRGDDGGGEEDEDESRCEREDEEENGCWCLANLLGDLVSWAEMLEIVLVWQVSAYQFFPCRPLPTLPSRDKFELLAKDRLAGEVPAQTLLRVGISQSKDSIFRRAYRLVWTVHGPTLKKVARTPYKELGLFHQLIKFQWESGVAGMLRAAPLKSEVVKQLLETPLLKDKGMVEAKLWQFIILFRRRFF